MAKPTSLPDAALTHAADQAQTVLEFLPPVTPPAPPEHPAFPETSVALPEQAQPLPEQTVGHVPDWLLPV